MFGISMGELLIIAVVALLFLGPEKLPDAAKTLSKGIRDFRKQTRELQQIVEDDNEIGGAIRDLKSALRGEDPDVAERRRRAAEAARKAAENAAKAAEELAAKRAAEGPKTLKASASGTDAADGDAPSPDAPDALPDALEDDRDVATMLGMDDDAPASAASPANPDPPVTPEKNGKSETEAALKSHLAALLRPASGSIPQTPRPLSVDAQREPEADDPGDGAGSDAAAEPVETS